MRLWATMIARDEAGRYLQASLRWLAPQVDGVHVYDDGSLDDTAAVAEKEGAVVDHSTVSLFEYDESAARQAALDSFARLMPVADGDVVISVDADEFVVGRNAGELRTVARRLERLDVDSARFGVPEVFEVADGRLRIRVDGHWGSIEGWRMWRWKPNPTMPVRRLACGSVPSHVRGRYVHDEPRDTGPWIMHLGYADPDDRQAKSKRYTDRPGHSTTHIRSILTRPTLQDWPGPTPAVWRGVQ